MPRQTSQRRRTLPAAPTPTSTTATPEDVISEEATSILYDEAEDICIASYPIVNLI